MNLLGFTMGVLPVLDHADINNMNASVMVRLELVGFLLVFCQVVLWNLEKILLCCGPLEF